jgi:DNA-directed RNA polymerase specialized sigma subunit
LDDKVQLRTQRKLQERQLWQQWKGGDQASLEPLFQSLSPLVRRISLNYQGNLPPAFVEAEVKKNVLRALHTYDPVGYPNVGLSTHIQNTTHKVKRELYKYQNPARLAEEGHLKVPSFQNVVSNLHEELGRPPTTPELARTLGESPQEIERLRAGTRRDLAAVEGQFRWQPPEAMQQSTILENISHELNPMERQVLHMTFGMAGQPKLQAKEIAQHLGTTPSRISQVRRDIAGRVEQHYGRRPEGVF